jgi:hypothetical protein
MANSFAAEGVDTSDPAVDSSALLAAGKTFVGRYISSDTSNPKNMQFAEAIARSRAGLDLFSNYEGTGTDFQDGRSAGVQDGTLALAGAKLVHQPPGTPIYFSTEGDIQGADLASLDLIQAYLEGAASVIAPTYTVGVYATTDVLDRVAATGAAQFFWQSESTGFNGGRNATQNAHDHLWQYLPPTVPNTDSDHAVQAWFGQWRAPLISPYLYAVWPTVSDDSLWWNSYIGNVWTSEQQVPGLGGTTTVPALALFQGNLYLAWKGIGSDTDLWWSMYNGQTWTAPRTVPVPGSSVRPALALFQNQLYLVSRGAGNDTGIYWSTYDGHTWSAEQKIPGATSNPGPGVAVVNGTLLVAFVGEVDQLLHWTTFDGHTWSSVQQVPGNAASSDAPGLTIFDNTLYMAWEAPQNAPEIWWNTFDGTTWSTPQVVPGVGTSFGPSLAVFDDTLYMAWLGAAGTAQSNNLFWNTSDGKTWSAQQEIPGVTAVAGPALLAP